MFWQEAERYPLLLDSVTNRYLSLLSVSQFIQNLGSRFEYAIREIRGEVVNRVLR